MDPKEVKGPDRMDTVEQERTRGTHAAEESEAKSRMTHDDSLSTMRQNYLGAGVDDRGAEAYEKANRDRANDELDA